jgi:hypothetical protein
MFQVEQSRALNLLSVVGRNEGASQDCAAPAPRWGGCSIAEAKLYYTHSLH